MHATQVETLRKQALAEVGVRQFSAEGLYSDPCVSFVLPDVICTFCNLCRDLDLCRDSRLMDEDEVCALLLLLLLLLLRPPSLQVLHECC